MKIRVRSKKTKDIDVVDLFQQGGVYQVPSYQPYNYQLNPVKMNFNMSQNDILQAPQVDIPEIDYEGLNKLQGKGHTNDVNLYIQNKKAAQNKLKQGISKYGIEFAQTNEFNNLLSNMTVSPDELNELVVRKEMSQEYAKINKENGGENEWVTDSNGSIFVRDNRSGEYKYVSPYDLNINTNLIPISSADAIQINDRDKSVAGNNFIMPAVSQVWGGSKSLKHINEQMDKLGKTERASARESLSQLGNLRGSDVFGSTSYSGSSSSNLTQLKTLANSLMSTMDEGALNYFRRQAIQQVGRVKGSEQEYNRAIQTKMHDLIWGYMSKAIDTSVSSKQSLTIDANLTKGISGGAGYEPPTTEDIGHYFGTRISVARDDQGNVQVMDGLERTRITGYDPKTGKYFETYGGNYNRIITNEMADRFRPEAGVSLAGRQLQFVSGKGQAVTGGIQTKNTPQLIQYIDPQGNAVSTVKSTALFTEEDLKGVTVRVQVKNDDGTFKWENRPIIKDGELDKTVAEYLGAKTVIEDDNFNLIDADEEQVADILISQYGIPKTQAEAFKQKVDGMGAGVNGVYEIPYFSPYEYYDIHNPTHHKTSLAKNLAQYENIKINNSIQQNSGNNQWMGQIDKSR